MRLNFLRLGFLISALACASACSIPVSEARSMVRLDTIAWEDTTRRDEDGAARAERSVDRDALELAIGGGYFDQYDRKLVGWEMVGGRARLGSLDGWSLRASLRWYWPISEFLRPYAALGAGGLYLEDLETAQGELHAGIGAEIPIARGWFLNLGLDYLYPGEPALDEATEKIETEFDGWALRLGLGWEF